MEAPGERIEPRRPGARDAEVTLPAGTSTQNHMHDPVEVLYVLSGTYDHEVNGKRYRLTPGMVGIVRPGDQVRHLATQGEDVKLLVLWAPGGEAARAFATAQGTTPAPVPEVPTAPEANPGQARAENAGRSLIGTPAPRFRLETIDGEAIDLGELYGKKAVYLKFWATWCVPCRQQMPHFEKAYQTASDNLAVIAVNVGLNDSREAIEAYRRELGITMPIVIDDGRLAEALNLTITPQHVVIGRDGRIEYVGFLADERLDTALRAAAQTRARTPEPDLPRQWTAAAGAEAPDRLPDLSAVTLDGRTFRTRDPSDRRPRCSCSCRRGASRTWRGNVRRWEPPAGRCASRSTRSCATILGFAGSASRSACGPRRPSCATMRPSPTHRFPSRWTRTVRGFARSA